MYVHFKFHLNLLGTLGVMVQTRKGNIKLKMGDNLKISQYGVIVQRNVLYLINIYVNFKFSVSMKYL